MIRVDVLRERKSKNGPTGISGIGIYPKPAQSKQMWQQHKTAAQLVSREGREDYKDVT
jgi:hypothetical protein